MLYVKVKPSMKSIKIMPSKWILRVPWMSYQAWLTTDLSYWGRCAYAYPCLDLLSNNTVQFVFFHIAAFQTIWIIVEILFMVILYILIIVLFLSNLTISLFLFRRQSTLRRMRELKAMLDEFRRERDEVINMISSKEEQRWLRLSSLLSFYP